jgi:hypothetical protein
MGSSWGLPLSEQQNKRMISNQRKEYSNPKRQFKTVNKVNSKQQNKNNLNPIEFGFY